MFGKSKENLGNTVESIEAIKDANFGKIEKFAFYSEFGTPAFLAVSDAAAKLDLGLRVEELVTNTFATRAIIDSVVAEQAAIRETIRVREDTIPGYYNAKSSIGELISHAINAESNLIHSNRAKGLKIPQSLEDRKNAKRNVVRFVTGLARDIRTGIKIEPIYSQ